eukprot:6937901-Prymnesium_polylepis.2
MAVAVVECYSILSRRLVHVAYGCLCVNPPVVFCVPVCVHVGASRRIRGAAEGRHMWLSFRSSARARAITLR